MYPKFRQEELIEFLENGRRAFRRRYPHLAWRLSKASLIADEDDLIQEALVRFLALRPRESCIASRVHAFAGCLRNVILETLRKERIERNHRVAILGDPDEVLDTRPSWAVDPSKPIELEFFLERFPQGGTRRQEADLIVGETGGIASVLRLVFTGNRLTVNRHSA